LRAEKRRVFAVWRAQLYVQRASELIPEQDRRWSGSGARFPEVIRALNRMEKDGVVIKDADVPGLYHYEDSAPSPDDKLVAPAGLSSSEYEVLMEAHPFAALSHFSALMFHGLTNEFSNAIHLVIPATGRADQVPIGVEREESDMLPYMPTHTPSTIRGRRVVWHRRRRKAWFGVATYRSGESPLRVVNPQRSLVDGLANPESCGGIVVVLRSWRDFARHMDVDTLIEYADMLDSMLQRQRVGYVLSELGVDHPKFEKWKSNAKRGGSNRLVAAEPFSSVFSEEWKISLNGPVEILHETPDEP